MVSALFTFCLIVSHLSADVLFGGTGLVSSLTDSSHPDHGHFSGDPGHEADTGIFLALPDKDNYYFTNVAHDWRSCSRILMKVFVGRNLSLATNRSILVLIRIGSRSGNRNF